MNAIIGKKIGMTSFFGPTGREFPVTICEVGPCTVVQVKTLEDDKYEAIQLGYQDKKESRTNKPQTGHFKKAGVTPKKVLKEIRFEGAEKVEVGTVIDSTLLNPGDIVNVTGVSKGKGFQGVVKRWNMKKQGASHGVHESHRGPGSIGMCAWPSRVHKGKHMPGRMGGAQVTVSNLEILKIVSEQNVIFIKGSVPGGKNGVLKIVRQEA